MDSFSKSQINRLGERIREGELDETDSRLLYEYRRSFTEAHDYVIATLWDKTDIEPTARVKSNASIRDKLLRQPTLQLTQMQDIAGCRLVVRDSVVQTAVVAKVSELFQKIRIRDRRLQPSHGYRAVHLIVEFDKKYVEIQVRTRLQHTWANLSEKLSDRFGMSLKYGGGPQERREALLRLSDTINTYEAEEVYIKDLVKKPASHLTDIEGDQLVKMMTMRHEIETLFEAAVSALNRTDGN